MQDIPKLTKIQSELQKFESAFAQLKQVMYEVDNEFSNLTDRNTELTRRADWNSEEGLSIANKE